jgi:hypothetical protein
MAARVSQPLLVEQVREGRWLILRDLVWKMRDGFVATARHGRETDFSSVPRLVRAIVPKDRTQNAGAIHDALYASGEVSRWVADRYWHEIARSGEARESLTMYAWRRWRAAGDDFRPRRAGGRLGPVSGALGRLGLMVGGWVAWGKYRKGQTPSV